MKTPSIHHARMVIYLTALLATGAQAQDPATFFKANCASCHTIGGGRLTGPDLKDVHKRRDADWFAEFVADPSAMINAGDPEAVALLQEYRGVIMPRVNGLTPQLIDDLHTLIITESALEKSRFIGMQLSDRALTAFDIARGDSLFQGVARFSSGGPACIACHHTAALGWLGGGTLGPDLTQVYGKLGGRKALSNWLASPGSPTMQPLYGPHPIEGEEILPLVAYLQSTGTAHFTAASAPDLIYLIIGLFGAIILLILSDVVWGGRIRNVRRSLLKGKR
ncbi:MAG: cytochrome c [Candidatus Marinimicrobia bacterium]|nr:cytochrome c [Candidatus Neomarinimicrobiota bacterium]